jgi:hypothetical protein
MGFRASIPAVVLCSLVTRAAAAGQAAAPQVGGPDPVGPSPIEQALMEHVCGPARTAGAAAADVYDACLKGQLQSLRTDFGTNLKRLSTAERRKIDAACANTRVDRGPDAYVTCVSDQLVALRERWNREKPPADEAAAEQDAAPPRSTGTTVPPAPPASRSRSWAFWIGAAATGVLVAGGGVLLLLVRSRRTPRQCRVCGNVPDAGDLCQTCRHEAAEALRRAAAERAEAQRAEERAREDAERRQRPLEEEQRLEQARLEREARLRETEQARQKERARLEAERRRQQEEARQRSVEATASDEQFDPYAILGVPRDATQETILAAYEAARARYDLSLVSGLGAEIQAHYQAKAQAVERAFELLGKQERV